MLLGDCKPLSNYLLSWYIGLVSSNEWTSSPSSIPCPAVSGWVHRSTLMRFMRWWKKKVANTSYGKSAHFLRRGEIDKKRNPCDLERERENRSSSKSNVAFDMKLPNMGNVAMYIEQRKHLASTLMHASEDERMHHMINQKWILVVK